MNISKINEQLKQILNELRKQDAGEEITDFESYEDALNKIKERYDQGLTRAYCPNAIEFEYNKNKYSLAVVLGVKESSNGMNPHGMAHYLDKHTYTNKQQTKPTEQDLIKAAKNVKTALSQAIKNNDVVLNEQEQKLIFSNGHYVYIVCLAKDNEELTYLHTLFKDEKNNYIKRQKRKLRHKKI